MVDIPMHEVMSIEYQDDSFFLGTFLQFFFLFCPKNQLPALCGNEKA